jgi:acyl-coenzyme A synthetase/AMP-(fatty) acid ligase
MRASGRLEQRWLRSPQATIALETLDGASVLGQPLEGLRGSSLVLATQEQLTAALCLIELDGVAARMVLCPPGLTNQELQAIALQAGADHLIVDAAREDLARGAGALRVIPAAQVPRRSLQQKAPPAQPVATEWVLLTSGSSGAPKLVAHTLDSLAGTRGGLNGAGQGIRWCTFYDIRRYGGLQILLRALLGGGSLLLTDPLESLGDTLARAALARVTHFTGTPSHWRRVLMSGLAQTVTPSYVRLSGEISDQVILDQLRASYPHARIVHAFASTEAGLAFEIDDGRAGFPEALLSGHHGWAELRIDNGSLMVRSDRMAWRYLNDSQPLRREDGFVDTQDVIELRDGRCHFVGRRGGIINVGGLKCHPEEIESVINRHPRVQGSLVRARRSPLLGTIVAADVMLNVSAGAEATAAADAADIRREILELCRGHLSAHKVPATIRIVASLNLSAAGKMQRTNA